MHTQKEKKVLGVTLQDTYYRIIGQKTVVSDTKQEAYTMLKKDGFLRKDHPDLPAEKFSEDLPFQLLEFRNGDMLIIEELAKREKSYILTK